MIKVLVFAVFFLLMCAMIGVDILFSRAAKKNNEDNNEMNEVEQNEENKNNLYDRSRK